MTEIMDNLAQLTEIWESNTLVAGIDEVGRGCLFGPVVASAIVFPLAALPSLTLLEIKDSKQLSPKKRLEMAKTIKTMAVAVQIGYASVREIERINILQASLLAMRRAVNKLTVTPQLCLVDGKFPIPDIIIPQETYIKGDQRSPIIASASIIAKVWRDELIIRLSRRYPDYDLAQNKGYGTKNHLLALQKYGVSPQHRLSFAPCRQLLGSP